MSLATGDSLLHGRHFCRRELGGAAERFRRVLRHHLCVARTGRARGHPRPAVSRRGRQPALHHAERRGDAGRLSRDLRELPRKYGLGAPFTERFFDLAQHGTAQQAAGFVGLIVANSFHEARIWEEADRRGTAAARPRRMWSTARALHPGAWHADGDPVRPQPRAGCFRGADVSTASVANQRLPDDPAHGTGVVGHSGSD